MIWVLVGSAVCGLGAGLLLCIKARGVLDGVLGFLLLIAAGTLCVTAAELPTVNPRASTAYYGNREGDHKHAAGGNSVKLQLRGLHIDKGEGPDHHAVTVYLVDDGRWFVVGVVSGRTERENFALDLGPTLRKLPAPPSDKAEIFVVGEGRPKFDSVRILPK